MTKRPTFGLEEAPHRFARPTFRNDAGDDKIVLVHGGGVA